MPSPSPSSDSTRERYETLLEVSESIASHRQLSTLFEELSRCLKPLVSFDFIGLSLIDPKTQTIRMTVIATEHKVVGPVLEGLPYGDSPTANTLATRQPYYVPDLAEERQYPIIREVLQNNAVQSVCILPLFTAQRDIGGLHLGSRDRHAYSPADIEFMRHVARQVAVAVDNALTHESAAAYETQLSRERDRLRILLEVNNAVVTCLGTKDLFQAISASLRGSFGMEYLSLALYDPRIEALRLRVLDFPEGSGAIREDAVIRMEDTLAGYVYRTREPQLGDIQRLQETFPPTAGILASEGLRSFCCVPLITRNAVLGTINLGSRKEADFSGDDLKFFSQVAGQIAIALDNALSYERIAELNEHLAEEKVYLEDEIRTDNRFEEIIGTSRALKTILKQVETVAPTDSTVLIYGETGTGKELLARAIHDLSSRRNGTFVKLNCAAIPTGLLESEMFGHEKGAFTGAIAQRIGRFELANRGSMFLDEVGEIPVELQSKLLRVLQEREFERLGSSRTIRTDARLVAATNRDLGELVEQRQFRPDLFYRLNVFPITIPPLRERVEDIPLLVRYFVQQFARRMKRPIASIPTPTMEALTRYSWPGNIRELQNFIERAVIVSPGPVLRAPVRELKRGGSVPGSGGGAVVTLETAERTAILRALRESGGKVGGDRGAAAKLGMKRTTLQARMRKLGITSKSV